MNTTEKATPEEVEAMFAELREGRRQHWVQILWRVLLVELVLFIHAMFHEHLKVHFFDDLKILVSTHSTLVAAVLIGFVGIAVLAVRLL